MSEPKDPHREGAVRVARRLRAEGHEAWLAGGCVRDLLLGERPKDWDIATDAPPERVQAIFPRTVAVGAAFGVIRVLESPALSYEVATFRADADYVDGRHPQTVRYSSSREEDVERRDLTINALLMDPESGEILDYVGGQADLEAGLVRAVGDARARFSEDRLRLLRAVRFAARLGFAIEAETWSALVAEAPQLDGAVSPERITQELEAILTGPRPGEGARLLEASGLAKACLPEPRPEGLVEALERLPEVAAGLDGDERAAVGWALLHAGLGPEALEPALRARRLSKARIRAAQDLLETEAIVGEADGPSAPVLRLVRSDAAPRRCAFLAARARSELLERWDAAVRRLEAAPPAREAFLSGADLKGLGISPGPAFKRILGEVEAAALEGRVTTREAALELALAAAERAGP